VVKVILELIIIIKFVFQY